LQRIAGKIFVVFKTDLILDLAAICVLKIPLNPNHPPPLNLDHDVMTTVLAWCNYNCSSQQESPAVADKPARRESMSKITPIRRAYNVVADNTGLSSFV